MQPVLFADDPQFWCETQRALGHTAYGGADTGEVLVTAQRIVAGDHDSWHDEWLAIADRIADEAEAALAAGHPVTGRDGMLRASNYYRCAGFFLHADPADPRIKNIYERSVACFRRAATLFTPPVEPAVIPFEGGTLHGYLYSGGTGNRPAIIMHNGFDGSAEELHFFGAAAAAERGYHVLTFDGPGQPAARHRDGLVFRPDWENVVSPVMDWLLARPGVDPAKVSLLGVSMGGILAARAAAFEHRLAACIAVDGLYDLGEADAAAGTMMTASYLDYTLAGGIAEIISCPTLICEAEEDVRFKGQPEAVYNHLTSPKALLRFTSDEAAGAYCHSGALRLAFGRIYDWLDDTLRGQ